ncbi:hypothetical protein HDG34_006114 [Paraburkholderia sp. HC6.4b]|uniref:ATP-dependent nuclease n=1 Tax=unclassified Paraburkholderia TaxID=2615204 RepID=UPI0016141C62|nr:MULTISPECIES: AAA family ATPase [unclassified Paraburkholderia]MBB5412143.1 hypothetical protein [Paraburkholderia sp. HC6.4b]MBB5454210.1 hypothetical protein [Paraburkholderia sp. Kb1A]
MEDQNKRCVRRFRFHGLRKLNWHQRPEQSSYYQHMIDSGHSVFFELGELLIVVGPNAGGKSTVIDLFRGLADASLWPTLARENYPGADYSGFDFVGSDFELRVRFSRTKPDMSIFEEVAITVVANRGSDVRCPDVMANRYGQPGDWVAGIQPILDDLVDLNVEHFQPAGAFPADELSDENLVEMLNELSMHFPSVYSNPRVPAFVLFNRETREPGRISVLFKDDPGQHGNVHRKMLPLGWLQLASILAFMRRCAPHSLVLLDEPDRHLHPSLQRVMLDIVASEGTRLEAQTIIATHSSVLTNPELGARVKAKVVSAARGKFEMLPDARRILDDLGVYSGDLVQANGIIWVEGPSDRIYLKKWIELYCQAHNVEPPIERVHYSFVTYGGALLKHLTMTDDHNEKVDLRRINRNFVIVVDKDLPEASTSPIGAEKLRILHEAAQTHPAPGIWVTQHYTVESYLPNNWAGKQKHVKESAGVTKVEGIAKVDLAMKFQREVGQWEGSYLQGSNVPEMIAALTNRIRAWQTPQEIIDLPYIPPYMDDFGDKPAC